jgi:hypothetical protein
MRSFLDARPEDEVVAWGVYHPASATLTLGAVEARPPPPTRASD